MLPPKPLKPSDSTEKPASQGLPSQPSRPGILRNNPLNSGLSPLRTPAPLSSNGGPSKLGTPTPLPKAQTPIPSLHNTLSKLRAKKEADMRAENESCLHTATDALDAAFAQAKASINQSTSHHTDALDAAFAQAKASMASNAPNKVETTVSTPVSKQPVYVKPSEESQSKPEPKAKDAPQVEKTPEWLMPPPSANKPKKPAYQPSANTHALFDDDGDDEFFGFHRSNSSSALGDDDDDFFGSSRSHHSDFDDDSDLFTDEFKASNNLKDQDKSISQTDNDNDLETSSQEPKEENPPHQYDDDDDFFSSYRTHKKIIAQAEQIHTDDSKDLYSQHNSISANTKPTDNDDDDEFAAYRHHIHIAPKPVSEPPKTVSKADDDEDDEFAKALKAAKATRLRREAAFMASIDESAPTPVISKPKPAPKPIDTVPEPIQEAAKTESKPEPEPEKPASKPVSEPKGDLFSRALQAAKQARQDVIDQEEKKKRDEEEAKKAELKAKAERVAAMVKRVEEANKAKEAKEAERIAKQKARQEAEEAAAAQGKVYDPFDDSHLLVDYESDLSRDPFDDSNQLVDYDADQEGGASFFDDMMGDDAPSMRFKKEKADPFDEDSYASGISAEHAETLLMYVRNKLRF